MTFARPFAINELQNGLELVEVRAEQGLGWSIIKESEVLNAYYIIILFIYLCSLALLSFVIITD